MGQRKEDTPHSAPNPVAPLLCAQKQSPGHIPAVGPAVRLICAVGGRKGGREGRSEEGRA